MAAVTLVGFAMLLTGCGDAVHLEGPGFEALGLTGNKNKGDAKVPDRASLVLPPDRARLPAPQQGAVAAAPPENWPTDVDVVRKAVEAREDQEQREYTDHGDWSTKNDPDEFEKLMDPMERQPGIMSGNRSLGDRFRDVWNPGAGQ